MAFVVCPASSASLTSFCLSHCIGLLAHTVGKAPTVLFSSQDANIIRGFALQAFLPVVLPACPPPLKLCLIGQVTQHSKNGLTCCLDPQPEAAVSATAGLLFFQLLFLSFRTLFVALFTFPDEFKMLLKERASGMYRLSAFYFARTASDLPMDMAIPTLFLLLVYFMGHLRYTAAAFFANFFTVILVMLVRLTYHSCFCFMYHDILCGAAHLHSHASTISRDCVCLC